MSRVKALVGAGLLTGLTDGAFATAQTLLSGSTFSKLWQGVASVLLGSSALEGGTPTVVIGILMHFLVAFTWSAIFVFGVARLPLVRKVLASPFGVAKVAGVYGPLIWTVMSLVVIPLMVHRPPTLRPRWLIQFFGHFVFVGLPMVGMGARSTRD